MKQIWSLGHEFESAFGHNFRKTCYTVLNYLGSIWKGMIHEGNSYLLPFTFFRLILSSTVDLWNYSTINGNIEFSGKLKIRTFNILNGVEYWVNTKDIITIFFPLFPCLPSI